MHNIVVIVVTVSFIIKLFAVDVKSFKGAVNPSP